MVGYAIRVTGPGQSEIIERHTKLEVPLDHGKIWLDGDVICLSFPAIENIEIEEHPFFRIAEHVIRYKADQQGITAAEATLYVRQSMVKKGNEALLLAFAEKGNDLSALMGLYKQILG